MSAEQAETKIKLWLFESTKGMNLLESIAEECNVKVNMKTVESIQQVGAGCYEILLDCIRDGNKVPVIVFVQFVSGEIAYHSVLNPTKNKPTNPENEFKLKLAELLYTVAFRLISEESANIFLGYGCFAIAWLLSLWLVYWITQ